MSLNELVNPWWLPPPPPRVPATLVLWKSRPHHFSKFRVYLITWFWFKRASERSVWPFGTSNLLLLVIDIHKVRIARRRGGGGEMWEDRVDETVRVDQKPRGAWNKVEEKSRKKKQQQRNERKKVEEKKWLGFRINRSKKCKAHPIRGTEARGSTLIRSAFSLPHRIGAAFTKFWSLPTKMINGQESLSLFPFFLAK